MERIDLELDCTHDIVIKYGVAECQNCGLEESKISKQLTDLEIEKKEWKQETIEDAAEQFANDCTLVSEAAAYEAFIAGSKFQAEKMFSEKQMDDAYDKGFKDASERMYSDMQEYAEFCIECDRKEMPLLLVQDWYEHYKNQNNEQ